MLLTPHTIGGDHKSTQGGGPVGYHKAVAVSGKLVIVAAAAAAAAPAPAAHMLVPDARILVALLYTPNISVDRRPKKSLPVNVYEDLDMLIFVL